MNRTRADFHDGPEHELNNTRPDTLVQDRKPSLTIFSCNARRVHTYIRVIFDRVGRFCLPVFFRFEPESGPKAGPETGGMRVTLRSALGL